MGAPRPRPTTRRSFPHSGSSSGNRVRLVCEFPYGGCPMRRGTSSSAPSGSNRSVRSPDRPRKLRGDGRRRCPEKGQDEQQQQRRFDQREVDDAKRRQGRPSTGRATTESGHWRHIRDERSQRGSPGQGGSTQSSGTLCQRGTDLFVGETTELAARQIPVEDGGFELLGT